MAAVMNGVPAVEALRSSWTAYREKHPLVRIRDAAAALDASEAELVAAGCAGEATRLRPDWYDVVLDLEGLGEVMALTRNDVFVHEKIGCYANARVFPDHEMGQTLDKDIDLRLFFRNWHFGFAVVREADDGPRRSLQFFDAYGTAVHKTHLRDESNTDHFKSIAETYRHEDQSSCLTVAGRPDAEEKQRDEDIEAGALRAAWQGLKNTHDFIFLLRDFGVDRQQAFRLAGDPFARKVAPSGFRSVLEAVSENGLPIMLFVGNHGCLQIHTGPVHRLADVKGWFNVLDPRFSLHVHEEQIAAAWVVRKPTADGDVHSLELFDEQGEVVCYVFGERKEGREERERWRALLASI